MALAESYFEARTRDRRDASILRCELEFVPAYLAARNIREAEVMLGLCRQLPMDAMWSPSVVPLGDVLPWVNRHISSGSIELGLDDVIIGAAGPPAIQWVFCHEGDIHFASPDVSLVDEMVARWRAAGIGCYRSAGLVDPLPSRIEWIDCP